MSKKIGLNALKFLGLFLMMSLSVAINPLVGAFVCVAVLLLSMFGGLRRFAGAGRGFAWLVGFFALGFLGAAGSIMKQNEEAHLAELRETDVAAYLVELQQVDERRWMSELAVLRPEEHAAELARREAAAAAERAARVAEECGEKNASLAYVMQQDAVRSQLRAPSTAEFPYTIDPLLQIRYGDNCTYHIAGYVDAQNAFGAMLRARYVSEIRLYPESGRWQVQSVQILE